MSSPVLPPDASARLAMLAAMQRRSESRKTKRSSSATRGDSSKAKAKTE